MGWQPRCAPHKRVDPGDDIHLEIFQNCRKLNVFERVRKFYANFKELNKVVYIAD